MITAFHRFNLLIIYCFHLGGRLDGDGRNTCHAINTLIGQNGI